MTEMPLELAYSEYGAGPPLLILHGLYGAGANWTSVARRLGEKFHVFTPDMRNHGASPWAPAMDYRAMAGDLARFIERHGLGQAAFIGHSMGGKAAMVLALSEPELVERLIVVDIAPVVRPREAGEYALAMKSLDLAGLTRRAEADARLRPAVPDDMVRAFLLQNLVSGPSGLRWRLNLDAILAGMADLAGFPALPQDVVYDGACLLLRGALSNYVREVDLAAFRARFPLADFVTIAGAGHWVHAERPVEFLAMAERFLAA
jgi:pimeloyl-ACP methyl ester carboxylesterase